MKTEIREKLKALRKNISAQRRNQASQKLFHDLSHQLDHHLFVLSYASFGYELDTAHLNKTLAEKGKLLLPKMENLSLRIFHILDLENQLIKNNYGILEPNPNLCNEVDISTISTILVPGLGFDSRNHRIGYGKGYYDRFLSRFQFPVSTIGIGFTEQYIEELPTDSHDITLASISLF